MEQQTKVLENIRLNIAELVQHAGSGHPGMGLSAAGIGLALWNTVITDTKDPQWPNRDRLVFSSGHGIVLQYVLHYLEGMLSKEELLTFRKKGSKLPGLADFNTLGTVEATTGSLGQGIANAVGMTMGLKHISNDSSIVYCLLGEGCLEEGLSYESMSLAGALALDNLIVLYDSNKTSIDGKTDNTFRDDIELRVKAMDWEYEYVSDGDDVNSIISAIENAKRNNKPTLIEVSTILGNGSPLAGDASTHGTPLGLDNIRKMSGFSEDEFLPIFSESKKYFADLQLEKIKKIKKRKNIIFNLINDTFPLSNEIILSDEKTIIEKSSLIMNHFAKRNHFLVGSADLAKSTKVNLNDFPLFSSSDYSGRNIAFGIRENAMCAISTGIYLATKYKTVISTYFGFSDIMKNSIRMAAIMKIPNIYVFTHDGISLANDGITHIPVEQIGALRSIPNIQVIRPASNAELFQTWEKALISTETPTVIVLTRELIPNSLYPELDQLQPELDGYFVKQNEWSNLTIVCSGSELYRAIQVERECRIKGIELQIYSVPDIGNFLENSSKRELFIDKNIFIMELSNDSIWYKIPARFKMIHQIDGFLNAALPEELEQEIGFDVPTLVKIITEVSKNATLSTH